jgi:hypothetical protein
MGGHILLKSETGQWPVLLKGKKEKKKKIVAFWDVIPCSLYRWLPPFWGKLMPPFSGLKNE